jgi:hypothetical protein
MKAPEVNMIEAEAPVWADSLGVALESHGCDYSRLQFISDI